MDKKIALTAVLSASAGLGVGGIAALAVLTKNPIARAAMKDVIADTVQNVLFGEPMRKDPHGRGFAAGYSTESKGYLEPVVLKTRVEAEEVMAKLHELVADYGHASFADLYYLVGMPTNVKDHKWGWTDLSRAEVRPGPEKMGFGLYLPQSIHLVD